MITVALAGKPNAGKSTFYTAATMADVDVANYPFTTIDANRGVTHVRTECPCLDRDERCGNENCRDGKRYVPVELLDVAGLVPGAHEGKGLGNQFLDDELTNAVVLNVVDASGATNAGGRRSVEVGARRPLDDVDFIEEEMDLWARGDRRPQLGGRRATVARSPDFDLEAAVTDLLTGFGATEHDVTAVLRELSTPTIRRRGPTRTARRSRGRSGVGPSRSSSSPTRVDAAPGGGRPPPRGDGQAGGPGHGGRRARPAPRRGSRRRRLRPGRGDVTWSATSRRPTREGLEAIRGAMAEYGGTGVKTALNAAVYDLLDRITVFPVQDASKWTDGTGNVLPDAFLLPAGGSPRTWDLAYAVHTDIGEGYLHAVDARSSRRIGESHELSEGDVVKIVSTAGPRDRGRAVDGDREGGGRVDREGGGRRS